MLQLSEEITSTENKVSFARQAYNGAVTAYNTYRQSFPAVIFAGMFGHSTMPNCCSSIQRLSPMPQGLLFIKSSTAVSAVYFTPSLSKFGVVVSCYNGEAPCCVEKYGGGPPCCIENTVGDTVLLYLSLSPMSTNFLNDKPPPRRVPCGC
ncbi:MAG: LemA family protein [Pirellulaceae bacterium]